MVGAVRCTTSPRRASVLRPSTRAAILDLLGSSTNSLVIPSTNFPGGKTNDPSGSLGKGFAYLWSSLVISIRVGSMISGLSTPAGSSPCNSCAVFSSNISSPNIRSRAEVVNCSSVGGGRMMILRCLMASLISPSLRITGTSFEEASWDFQPGPFRESGLWQINNDGIRRASDDEYPKPTLHLGARARVSIHRYTCSIDKGGHTPPVWEADDHSPFVRKHSERDGASDGSFLLRCFPHAVPLQRWVRKWARPVPATNEASARPARPAGRSSGSLFPPDSRSLAG